MDTGRSRALSEHVILANQLSSWLQKAGVPQAVSAVDFADIVFAARKIDGYLRGLLDSDPTQADQIDAAYTLLSTIHVWLFSELKGHLVDLETAWPLIDARFEELSITRKTGG